MSNNERTLLVAVASIACFACRTAHLSQAGADVQISPSAPVDFGYPPGACKSLGYLSGRGGGSFAEGGSPTTSSSSTR